MSEISTASQPGITLHELEGIHKDTLGLLAVPEPVHGAARQIELGCVRDQLREMGRGHAELFDEFCRTAVPLDLQSEKRSEMPDDPWNAWLLRGTSDQQLLDFLKWNVDSVSRQQTDDRFQSILADERVSFKEGVRRGLAEGWLHPDFEAAIEGVDGLQVYVGDAFNTHAKGRAGFHTRGSKAIVIGGARRMLTEGFDDLYESVTWVAGHEFNHPFGEFGFRYMDEAFTEHHAQSYKYGQPHILRPEDRRHNERQTYAPERALTADFMGPVAVKFASLAYSQTEGKDQINDCIDKINSVWEPFTSPGQSAFSQLNTRMRILEQQYQSAGQLPATAGKQAAIGLRRMLHDDPPAAFAVQDGFEQVQLAAAATS